MSIDGRIAAFAILIDDRRYMVAGVSGHGIIVKDPTRRMLRCRFFGE